jgi:chorismate-pyruvate lyase
MLEEPATRRSDSTRHPKDLLQEAFSRHGLGAPELTLVSAEEIPEPFHTLLVHDADMTSTLKRFHGDSLVLKRLHVEEIDGELDREVVLCTESKGRPVEYGVIRIALTSFDPAARESILAGVIPLGQILDDFAVSYVSRPSEYFRIQNLPYLEKELEDPGVSERYGRINSLTSPSGELLAEVIEILPSAPFDSQS